MVKGRIESMPRNVAIGVVWGCKIKFIMLLLRCTLARQRQRDKAGRRQRAREPEGGWREQILCLHFRLQAHLWNVGGSVGEGGSGGQPDGGGSSWISVSGRVLFIMRHTNWTTRLYLRAKPQNFTFPQIKAIFAGSFIGFSLGWVGKMCPIIYRIKLFNGFFVFKGQEVLVSFYIVYKT